MARNGDRPLGANKLRMLRMVAKRDHPGGEPRLDWLDKGRAGREMLDDALVAVVEGSGKDGKADLVVLTDKGRNALAEADTAA